MLYSTRRGSERVWRTVYERNVKTCRRNRWKGFSEFMFWGCFSYNFKGPCHIWATETAAEKRAAEEELAKRNIALELDAKALWEITKDMRRHLRLRGAAKGKEPQWVFNKTNGKLVREGKAGGIDWYRYQEVILKQKLLPFAKEHSLIVQEDGAPSHSHKEQQKVYNLFKVIKLLWPANSPDLNMIEPCW